MKRIPYSTQWITGDDCRAVAGALRAERLTQGPGVREFEDGLARYCGVRYAVAVSSGTAALHLACLAAGVAEGARGVTSPISFVASANCILYCGGRPDFADIQEDTVNVEPRAIEAAITKATRVLIPVDFAGHPSDLDEIRTIAKRHGLVVIEDASHALGSDYKGKKVGGLADMTVFSFHPVKTITTGEGGAILTDRKDLYERLLALRTHGIVRDQGLVKQRGMPWYYEMRSLGFNYRITDFQCALGISQLKKLNKFIEARRELAAFYTDAFRNVEEIMPLGERPYVRSAYHLYVVRLRKRCLHGCRKRIFHFLNSKGIYPQVHYIPIYLQPYYAKLGYEKGLCPRAEAYYDEGISLPLYPKMKVSDARYVVRFLISAIKLSKRSGT